MIRLTRSAVLPGFPDGRFAIAVQINTSARAPGRSPGAIVNLLAAIVRSRSS